MKRVLSTNSGRVFLLSLVATSLLILGITAPLLACGWGQSGGSDYVPQRRDSESAWANQPALSAVQARDVVTNYVKRLNPALEIGNITDNGSFYEVEILDSGNEIVQLLGVDKQSGRLILIN